MIEYGMVKIEQADLEGFTQGLEEYGCLDVTVCVNEETLTGEIEPFLLHLVKYVVDSGARILPEETMSYGYWLVKFKEKGNSLLEIWEYNDAATEFVKGANLTLRFFKEQTNACRKYNSKFLPPRPDKKVAISEGVLEGDLVEGVRYSAPEHMSGWYITTGRYNGDYKTLQVIHLFHLTKVRPDLARVLALSPGFRFRQIEHDYDVWFDNKCN